ncbi:MAG: hypothetical protein C4532_10590 [Candidatus Abyssobacteria bacterium SURF_17]|uniref:Glycosyltransferase family 1 protein n=1 Tax=Candidatus Abyssobacteria bacterium SURF_17 TaxID=2093361 RepID=A0A419EXF6_9BACT|nr:MAG: hypothetical protein C4532_10590 [Candidatus Abyssubacteria bacterium SURF_17]
MNATVHKNAFVVKDLLDVMVQRGRRKTLRLGILHYHLKPGGVLSVMRDIAVALARHAGYEAIEIDIVAAIGARKQGRGTFDAVARDPARVTLRMVDIPSLAYRSEPYPSRASFLNAADKIAHEILEQLNLNKSTAERPYILHSHNISLGKNPAATMAFKLIAEQACREALPLWLINHVHDFAENNRPEQMNAFLNCTGRRDESFARSFMYPNERNILYLTINSSDIENLIKIGIPSERVFLLPDPIDVSQFEQKPLWQMDENELGACGLAGADYRGMLLERISAYAGSKNQLFDAALPPLLSPLKVMRRKNNTESLLLLMLFKHLGRAYQLLITLDANSPPDIAYSRGMKRFARSKRIPAVVGFGSELISGTGRRIIRNGRITRFSMCDLHALCSGIVTTSVVEGFGLTYHEGWLSGKPIIGRKIPEIVRDFERTGMNLDHMYSRLAASLEDLPTLRERLKNAYEARLGRLARTRKQFEGLPSSPTAFIIEAKLFRAGDEDCVDFADLNGDMQFELLDRVAVDPLLRRRFIDRNPAVEAAFRLLTEGPSELIETNRAVVRSKYSLAAMAQRLESLFELGDSLYTKGSPPAPLTEKRHAAVIERYRTPENVRLLF